MGRLIPAGTGLSYHTERRQARAKGPEEPEESLMAEEVEAAGDAETEEIAKILQEQAQDPMSGTANG